MLEFLFIACGLIGWIGIYLLAAKLVLWLFGFDCHKAIKF